MVFFIILVTIIILTFLIMFSKIRIQIINFSFNSQTQRHINKDYQIIIKLYILGILPILKLNITKAKLENIKLKEKIQNIDFKIIEDNQKVSKEILPAIKKANISIKNINLKIEIGTENASLTSIIIPIVSTIISVILRKKIKNFEDQIFIINPIFINQNLVNIYISGIFEIKMSHIINIIYILNRKEKKGVKKYERSSNRRAYDYSYE